MKLRSLANLFIFIGLSTLTVGFYYSRFILGLGLILTAVGSIFLLSFLYLGDK